MRNQPSAGWETGSGTSNQGMPYLFLHLLAPGFTSHLPGVNLIGSTLDITFSADVIVRNSETVMIRMCPKTMCSNILWITYF